MQVCLTCHPSSASSLGDVDIHQAWNLGELTVDDIIPAAEFAALAENEADQRTLLATDPWADLPYQHMMCRDCHEARGEQNANHPWRVAFAGDPAGLKLFNSEVLCATCHDPHLNQPGNLRLANQGSALCLSCHNI